MATVKILQPVRHDGLDIDPDEELPMLTNEQADRLAAAGAAVIVERDAEPQPKARAKAKANE